jgi:hypothetical protein
MSWKFWQKKAASSNYVRRYVTQTDAERSHAERERDMALAGTPDNDPTWQAVLALVDEHAESECTGALAPGLTDDQRQFAAGAAATADYLAKMLRDARVLALQRLAKEKSR